MTQFDPNWSSYSEKHHLVPNTYLKAWKHNKSLVYYIDKQKSKIDFASGDYIKNTSRIFRINNFYSRRVGALFQSQSDCDKYFAPLKSYKYTVKINGIGVVDSTELNKKFYEYENWAIYDDTNNLISEFDKCALKKEIQAIHIRDLEEAWNRMYENNWPDVRSEIVAEVNKNFGADKISSVRREEFIRFMVSIEWRTEPAHPVLEEAFNNLINLLDLSKVLDEPLLDSEKMYPFIDTHREEFKHNLLLSMYYKFFNNKGPIYEEFKHIYDTMDIHLLIPESGYEFITSDNPVCRFTNSRNELEYIFPITPQLACTVLKSKSVDKEHYFVRNLNKDEVLLYNDQIKNNCIKGYILHQPHLKMYFK
ncbi:DUF4238 domain-containing protein [Bacillus atrophaeus]|uniref:DUF4238 domain-containing protein n=1 Tax=Bacillus atrophaeus TaxID=1452 RepID=UPI00227F37AF|nr:DUF4238 domain-containing protein [Bacillus atrophaeus]MCY7945557.1 DUF4238 domain-containing protein [Bacillus atrophaeus]MCY8097253.1 DUF4238 domain-containing protein [Bacillus atrophaeus]MCY9170785.1 DUF4238 domain-containing protein [Bacillus atrophaeus]MEC0743146.1 DUF4238 domain-containing protein [Bacillus atrophaeus]MEC0747430.1 DUF4238 domain-containing protein [Bacillus atrophaeus]